jgi:hypothetical protein
MHKVYHFSDLGKKGGAKFEKNINDALEVEQARIRSCQTKELEGCDRFTKEHS